MKRARQETVVGESVCLRLRADSHIKLDTSARRDGGNSHNPLKGLCAHKVYAETSEMITGRDRRQRGRLAQASSVPRPRVMELAR